MLSRIRNPVSVTPPQRSPQIGARMTRFLVFVLLAGITALGTESSSSTGCTRSSPSRDIQQGCPSHTPEQLPDLPPARRHRANVFADVCKRAALGEGNQEQPSFTASFFLSRRRCACSRGCVMVFRDTMRNPTPVGRDSRTLRRCRGMINGTLLLIGRCEAYLASRVRLPFGLSVLVAAQKDR